MTAINTTMGLREWSLLIALSVLWGGSFFFVEVAVGSFGPLTIVAFRVGLAAAALHVIVLAMGLRMPVERSLWFAFLGMGLLNNIIPFSLTVWGQAHIASSLASILNATTPIFTVIVAHFLTSDEKFTTGRVAGVALGFAGVTLMIGVDAIWRIGTDTVAQLAVLGAAMSFAFAGIYGRRFRTLGCSPLVTATGQVTASALVLAPLALVVERPWAQPAPAADVWGAIVGLALLSTALAYILYFRILATAGATNLLLVTFLIPITATALGITVLGEQLALKHVIGAGLIGLGLAAIDGRIPWFARGIWIRSRMSTPFRPGRPSDRGH
ncbi:MAG: DMT family transporter [Ectothiorhodospiraceae bacterium]|nr:DMT family transporter [Ectothiorhodospiraceae bacterium]